MANATTASSRIFPARLRSRLPRASALGLCAALCLALPAFGALPQPEMSHSLTTLKPGKSAPDFALPDIDGKVHRLSEYRGKVVLVNFWATWCPPCRREIPSMERLLEQLKGKPFVVLAIDQEETADSVFVFTGQLDPAPTFPILLDRTSAVAPAWGVLGLPTSFIVDQRALNASLDNIGQTMTDARLLPSMKDGKVEGFRVSEVKPAGVFGMVGIRNGDVLLRINDFAIDSPDKAIQSFVSLKGQSRIKLDLIRDGQPTTLNYDIR